MLSRLNNSVYWWLMIGSFYPIAVVFLMNIGIILGFSNKVDALSSFVLYLSIEVNNDISLQVLISLATIFTVFFSFLQISYSIRHLPPTFISEYVLKNKNTLLLISYCFSILLISYFFSLFEKTPRLNLVIILGFVPISIFIVALYFKWLVNVIKIESMTELILKKFSFGVLRKLEKTVIGAKSNLDSLLVQRKDVYPINLRASRLIFSNRALIVKTPQTGMVVKIDMEEIDKLLVPVAKDIKSVEFYIEPGEILFYKNSEVVKINPRENELTPKLSIFIKEKEDDILKCIKVESLALTELLKPIDDVVDVYVYIAHQSSSDLKKVIETLVEFLHDNRWELNASEQKPPSAIRGYIFESFIEKLRNIAQQELNEHQIGELIAIIYSLRSHIVLYNDLQLLRSILSVMNTLLWEMLNRTKHYEPRIATQILYLKEIVFSYELIKRTDTETEEQIEKSWQLFYDKLTSALINSATQAMYYLVDNFYKHPAEEMRRYLLFNAETLVSLLEIRHWEKLEESHKAEKFGELAKEILYWSIFTYRRCYIENRIPSSIISEVVMPVAAHCYSYSRFLNGTGENIYDKFIYACDFTDNTGFERYEDPDIIAAATGVGHGYDFDDFWILLALWRHRSRENFVPVGSSNDPETTQQRLNKIRAALMQIDHEKFSKMLNIDAIELGQCIAQYRNHLNSLESA